MPPKPLASRRCEYCGGEFKKPPTAKKDIWGNLYTVKSEYYLPFRCPICGGLFCEAHRLPENHQCIGQTRKIPIPIRSDSTENRFTQEEYNRALAEEYGETPPEENNQPNHIPEEIPPIEYEGPQPKTEEKPGDEEEKTPSIEYEGPQSRSVNRFSEEDYNRVVVQEKRKDSLITFLATRVLVVALVIAVVGGGIYVVTNTSILSDFGAYVQNQTSTITTTISSITNNTETTGRYTNYQLGLVKGPDGVIANSHGDFVILYNNRYAKNPTYPQLLTFLKSDNTDDFPYTYVIRVHNSYTGAPEDHVNVTRVKEIIDGKRSQETPNVCSDFAEMLHNNAEMAGIRCAYVSIKVGGSSHALNAFNTTDRGIVYIDCTGVASGLKLSNCDKIVDVLRVGSNYIPRSLFPEAGWSEYYENAGTVTSIYMTWDGNWRN